MGDRARFDEAATARLAAAAGAAMADTPELRAVAVVFLWDFPDQSGIPSAFVWGADGAVSAPDELLRLQHAVLGLQRQLVGASDATVRAVIAMAGELARADHNGTRPRTVTAREGGGPREAAGP